MGDVLKEEPGLPHRVQQIGVGHEGPYPPYDHPNLTTELDPERTRRRLHGARVRLEDVGVARAMDSAPDDVVGSHVVWKVERNEPPADGEQSSFDADTATSASALEAPEHAVVRPVR